MNIAQCTDKAIKLIASYSNSGNIIASTDNLDYTLRAKSFIDQAQKEIAQFVKIHAVYSFSQEPLVPCNGIDYGFTSRTFIPNITGDLTDISGINGQAYYFEVDKPCSVVIEESSNGTTWSTISTITVAGISSFMPYSGLIAPTLSSNIVRLRFTGTYPFTRRNSAIWAIPFASVTDIPQYAEMVAHIIPDDNFMEFSKIVYRTDYKSYSQMLDISSIGRKTFLVRYDFKGGFDLHYYKVPETITDSTLDTQELEVYPGMPQEAVAYYVGAHMIIDEFPSLGNALLSEYMGKLSNLKNNEPSTVMIPDISWGW